MSVRVETMRAGLDPAAVADLRDRLARTRWSAPAGADDWDAGVPQDWLRDLVVSWRRFDVDSFQERLDALDHVRVTVGGQAIHAIRVPGRGPSPHPLVLTHGWPGSCLEYLDVIGPLTDPVAYGGDAADAFDVVIPSLPGFAWSAPPPPGGLVAAQVADLWHQLMTDGLGYRRYAAHGGDLGAGVTAWLARDHPEAVTGIHLSTPGLAPPPEPWTEAEADHFAAVERWSAEEGGYAHQHATKPATLAAALQDSPVGLAAWIGEKVVSWSSVDAAGGPSFGTDRLHETLTLYWVTGTIGSSLLPYWAYRRRPDAALPAGDPSPVPTAISVYGGERIPFPKPPRELAERYFTLSAWTEHDTGGHFPAVAEPELLARTLRQVLARPA